MSKIWEILYGISIGYYVSAQYIGCTLYYLIHLAAAKTLCLHLLLQQASPVSTKLVRIKIRNRQLHTKNFHYFAQVHNYSFLTD